jgi:hypothetical protein
MSVIIGEIFGGNFQNAMGIPLSGGHITFQLSQQCQVAGGDAQIVPNNIISYVLNSSGSVNLSSIWFNTQLNPPGTYYTVKIYNQGGQLCAGPMIWILSGSSPLDLGSIVSSGTGFIYITYSVADAVNNYTTSQTIVMASGLNLFGTCVGGSSGISLALPSASLYPGLSVKLIKTDSGVGYVTVTGGVYGNYILSNQEQYVIFESNGTSWYVMGNN